MAVEPFSSTTVGSAIPVFYKCQSGLLPEERRNSACGFDGLLS